MDCLGSFRSDDAEVHFSKGCWRWVCPSENFRPAMLIIFVCSSCSVLSGKVLKDGDESTSYNAVLGFFLTEIIPVIFSCYQSLAMQTQYKYLQMWAEIHFIALLSIWNKRECKSYQHVSLAKTVVKGLTQTVVACLTTPPPDCGSLSNSSLCKWGLIIYLNFLLWSVECKIMLSFQ